MEVILDTRNQLTFLEKDVILMGFGKRVCELLAVIASLLLIGALVWYLSSGFGDRGYEKEGTLVWEEQNTVPEEEAYPAFVTDPVSMMFGQQEIQRSGRGL